MRLSIGVGCNLPLLWMLTGLRHIVGLLMVHVCLQRQLMIAYDCLRHHLSQPVALAHLSSVFQRGNHSMSFVGTLAWKLSILFLVHLLRPPRATPFVYGMLSMAQFVPLTPLLIRMVRCPVPMVCNFRHWVIF